MQNEKIFHKIIFILVSILLLLFDWIKGRLILLTANSLGAELVVGLLAYIPYVLYCTFIIWSVIYMLKRIKLKKLGAFVPLIIVSITLLILFFIPYSKTYLNFDYETNKVYREKTIEMVASKVIQQYQSGEDEYIAPYRLTSYTGKIYVQDVDGVTKVLFYSYKGFTKSRIIVYSSDDSGIIENDFNFGVPQNKLDLGDIKRLDKNWYSATITP